MPKDYTSEAPNLKIEEAAAGQSDGRTTHKEKICSRRALLKQAGMGLAAGLWMTGRGASRAEEPKKSASSGPHAFLRTQAGKIPFSLIIDDGSPVDPLFYEIPGYETPYLVPLEFVQRVAETFDHFDLRGKFTLIPMPSCLGRLDQSLKRVPQAHLEGFLKVMRERIAPRFDITPEFLTHLRAYDLKTGSFLHIFEDVWISQASLEEIVEYFVLAFTILKNVGLPATGITSPWVSGIDVEKKYAQALGEAQWKVFQRKLTWYFLHDTEWGAPRHCSIEYEARESGQQVVSVPANTAEVFWSMELTSQPEREQFIRNGIDRLLSPDGRTGRIRDLVEGGFPVVLVTHWQSLYTQGTGLGLEGISTLAQRIQKVFGNTMEWVTCLQQAQLFVNSRT
jgi:hypothetical protein